MKIIDRKIIQRYYDKNKKTHNQLNNKVIESNEDLDKIESWIKNYDLPVKVVRH